MTAEAVVESDSSFDEIPGAHLRFLIPLTVAGALLTAAVAMWGQIEGSFALLAAALFAYRLPALAWVDFQVHRLPNAMVLASAIPMVLLLCADAMFTPENSSRLWVGLATGFGIAVLLVLIAIVSGGGLGMGDVKFSAVAGVILGFKSVALAFTCLMMLAPFIAAIVMSGVYGTHAVKKMVSGEKTVAKTGDEAPHRQPFAYGPYLILATCIGLFAPASFNLLGM